MAKGKASNLGRVNSLADQAEEQSHEEVYPRKGRSKRKIVTAETSQICFRVLKGKHKELRVYCTTNGIEIGEAMERALDAFLAETRRT
ncbi:MAG: hypothetical protein RIC85_05065 [Gammaproteobacteria bacterium]|uniref:hypothetical protein n=1 Tax=Thalassobaculum sp. TaxID=2022740 RepID=UPI0032EA9FF6